VNLDGNQASIRKAYDAGLLAGAVTVVWQHGEVLQLNEIGYRDIDARLPMQRDTLFRIASMTKPVTVAAAMSLVDKGKLALSDPIVRWLPEFADMRVLDDENGPLDRTHPVQRAIWSRICSPTPAVWPTRFPSAGRSRGRMFGCRSARVRTSGWPHLPTCRWCTNPASG
jgi:hypothetical protein